MAVSVEEIVDGGKCWHGNVICLWWLASDNVATPRKAIKKDVGLDQAQTARPSPQPMHNQAATVLIGFRALRGVLF
jgi:hypothetical protein